MFFEEVEKSVQHFLQAAPNAIASFASCSLLLLMHAGRSDAMAWWRQYKRSSLRELFKANVVVAVTGDTEIWAAEDMAAVSCGSNLSHIGLFQLFSPTVAPVVEMRVAHNDNCAVVVLPHTNQLHPSKGGVKLIRTQMQQEREKILQLLSQCESERLAALNYDEFQTFTFQLLQANWRTQVPREFSNAEAVRLFPGIDVDHDCVVDADTFWRYYSVYSDVLLFPRVLSEHSAERQRTARKPPTQLDFLRFAEVLRMSSTTSMSDRMMRWLFAFIDVHAHGTVSTEAVAARCTYHGLVHNMLHLYSAVYKRVAHELQCTENYAAWHFDSDASSWALPLVQVVPHFDARNSILRSRSCGVGNLFARSLVSSAMLDQLRVNGYLSSTDPSVVVPLVTSASFALDRLISNVICERDICMCDPYPSRLFIAQMSGEELLLMLCTSLQRKFSRETLFHSVPQHPGFPHLANVGIVFNIDDPRDSRLFDANLNTENSLSGALKHQLASDSRFMVIADETTIHGSDFYTFMLARERWLTLSIPVVESVVERDTVPPDQAVCTTTAADGLEPRANLLPDPRFSRQSPQHAEYSIRRRAVLQMLSALPQQTVDMNDYNRVMVWFVDATLQSPSETVLARLYDEVATKKERLD
eukprot:TRINITY_DN3492_c0_g1_i2.p1 TRINITY_DN3492_c0_g1~~TRINITY_DN3492_c0_g1_i2.p1  ORF type:complete len:642 (-),score=89.03 TRINITY_DN3492_c0_g1_i2:48-1973(-)